MKNRIAFTALACSTFLSSGGLADVFTLDTKIEDVTVYRDGGAEIVRTGTIKLPAGDHTVLIANLQRSILSSHIAPHAVTQNSSAIISSLKIKDQPSGQAASEQQAALQSQIDAVEQKINALENRVASLDMQLNFLRSVRSDAQDGATPANLDKLKDTLEFLGQNAGDLFTNITAEQDKIKKLISEKAALERELERSGKLRKDYKEAALHVSNDRAQPVEFQLSYFVKDARWSMDINSALDTSNNKLDIRVSAKVTQQTGENWQNVNLALSDARPSSFVGDIIVPSEFIEFAELERPTMHMAADQIALPEANFGRMASKQTAIIAGRFNKTYKPQGAVNIVSSGEAQTINLQQAVTNVETVTRAAPFQHPQAYIYADTVLKDFSSIRGVNVTLFRDGHYSGAGRWPNLESDRPIELPFGEDRAIAVSYTEQAPEDGQSGLINKKNEEEKRYLITVQNNADQATTVEIFDRYPVSTHEDIEVKPLKTATKPTEMNLNNRPGIVKWRKIMQPGETWHIRHEYKVSYPSDKVINKTIR